MVSGYKGQRNSAQELEFSSMQMPTRHRITIMRNSAQELELASNQLRRRHCTSISSKSANAI